MAMISEVVNITPEMAAEWLEHNMANNRPLNTRTVNKYARIMRGGGWNLTHQGIAFDEKGTLVDGQHRLKAIVTANMPVRMMVTRGVEHKEGEAFSVDVGMRRTTNNIMQMSGITDNVYRDMSSIVSAYFRWKRPGAYRPEPVEIMDYIDRHYADIAELRDIMSAGESGGKGKHRITAFVGAALLSAMYRGVDKRALQAFCNVYRLNDINGCGDYNPKHALNIRDFVRSNRDSSNNFSRVECAICAFVKNKATYQVRDNTYPYNAEFDG